MKELLYTVIITEASTIVLLLFKTPFTNPILSGIDNIKRGTRASVLLLTLSTTIFILLSSSIFSILRFTTRDGGGDGDGLNPADQLLFAEHLLHSSLMGFILFLGLMIDRLHQYIRELRLRRKEMDIKTREMQVETFKDMIRQIESDLQNKIKEARSSEATAEALRRQSAGLLSEYNRLLAENQELRNQLQILDRRVSRSASKKNS